jgi:tetratricopeptide (TPR) repeat protein
MERLLQHEQEQLDKDYELLKQLEDDLRWENDLRRRGKLDADIKEIKQRILEREAKLKGTRSLNQMLFEGYKLLAEQKFDKAEKKFEEASRIEPESPDPWYWKAKVALAKENRQVALKYINKALNFDSCHLHSLVLKIELLLLSGGNDRLEAQKIASQSYGISDALNSWLDCLKQREMFANLVNTNSELDRRCPPPIYRW